jgi:hypothetical protein
MRENNLFYLLAKGFDLNLVRQAFEVVLGKVLDSFGPERINILIELFRALGAARPRQSCREVFGVAFLTELSVSGFVSQKREMLLLARLPEEPKNVGDGALAAPLVADNSR